LAARPVFVDIDKHTMNIDPNLIEKSITKRTSAIIPVHFAGRPCDMDAIMSIAKKHHLDLSAVIFPMRNLSLIGRFPCRFRQNWQRKILTMLSVR